MEQNRKDFSTAIGILIAFALVLVAVMLGSSAKSFVDMPSVLIVLGGTCAITLASFSFSEFFKMPGVIMKSTFRKGEDPSGAAHTLLDLAETARKKGILALQNDVEGHEVAPFLSRGVMMVVDGMDAAHVERVLRQEIHSSSERHMQCAAVLRKMAEVSPAMGLIGTLIGLVQMLGNLDDPSKIGPAMAVALLTTLYGAMMAYMLFSPLAAKLERNSAEETLIKTLYLRGIGSIARQENPRLLESLLNTILPPAKRVQYFD